MHTFKMIGLFLLLTGTVFVWAKEESAAQTPERISPTGVQEGAPYSDMQSVPTAGMQTPPPPIQKMLETISDEDALAFEKKEHPEQDADLMAMKTANPDQFARRILMTKMLMTRIRNMQQNNPGLYNQIEKTRMNRIQIRQKADEYRKETDSTKKEELKKQMMDLLSQDFDASMINQKRRLEEMKKRLEEQETRLQESETNKAKILEENFEKVINTATLTPPQRVSNETTTEPVKSGPKT